MRNVICGVFMALIFTSLAYGADEMMIQISNQGEYRVVDPAVTWRDTGVMITKEASQYYQYEKALENPEIVQRVGVWKQEKVTIRDLGVVYDVDQNMVVIVMDEEVIEVEVVLNVDLIYLIASVILMIISNIFFFFRENPVATTTFAATAIAATTSVAITTAATAIPIATFAFAATFVVAVAVAAFATNVAFTAAFATAKNKKSYIVLSVVLYFFVPTLFLMT